MAAITIKDRSASYAKVFPASGNPTGMFSPNESDMATSALVADYTVGVSLSAGEYFALAYATHKLRAFPGLGRVKTNGISGATLSLVAIPTDTLEAGSAITLASGLNVGSSGNVAVNGDPYVDVPAGYTLFGVLASAGAAVGKTVSLVLPVARKY